MDDVPTFEDKDFKFFRKLLKLPKEAWNKEVKTQRLKIYRKKDMNVTSNYMVKVVINLPGVSKEQAFRALGDYKIRRQWD